MTKKDDKNKEKAPYFKPEAASLKETNDLTGQQSDNCIPAGSGANACGQGYNADFSAPTPAP